MSLPVDHLIYAAPTLASGMDAIEALLGVRPVYGGQHPGRGTHNALLSLGPDVYLEVIAPDPAQPEVSRPLWIAADSVTAPRLIYWAAKSLSKFPSIGCKRQISSCTSWKSLADALASFRMKFARFPSIMKFWTSSKSNNLEALVEKARSQGLELGEVSSGSRSRPDGQVLRWQLTAPSANPADGILPFFIDWGDTPHPARSLPWGGEFVSLEARHPEPERVNAMMKLVGLGLNARFGPKPELLAHIRTSAGIVIIT